MREKTFTLLILHIAVFLAGWTGIFGRLISLGGLPLVSTASLYYLRSYGLLLAAAIIGATPLVSKIAKKLEGHAVIAYVEPVVLCVLLLAVTAFLVGGSFNPFLYFRF